jgi:hypothetical protein
VVEPVKVQRKVRHEANLRAEILSLDDNSTLEDFIGQRFQINPDRVI